MNKKQKGFSLIELLIVVAIILIIAAIAIPNLLRARIAANEASAVGSMRTIVTAEISYTNSFQVGPTVLLNLATPAGGCPAGGAAVGAACLIDSNLAGGQKSGYLFVSNPTPAAGTPSVPATGFEASATPATPGTTGQRAFCADMSGVMHFNTTGIVIAPPCAALGAAAVLQ